MIVRHIRRKDYDRKKRVSAYCRVSTDKASQEESFETQIAAYERLIRSNPEWEYAGIYSDEGKSATSARHRAGFQRMIADALEGKIDIILVKSISRFSRNIVDCQTYVEKLREQGVSVRFERENIDSLNPACSMMFSLLSAIAQDESRSISENVKWSIARRHERGEYKISNNQVLGYDADEQGKPVPNGDAWIVQMVFRLYTEGKSIREVTEMVAAAGGHSLRSSKPLSCQAVRYILKNEIYTGDRILQKRAPVNYLTKKPDLQAEYKTYFLQDVHEPLIDRDTWEKAQGILRRRELAKEEALSGYGPMHISSTESSSARNAEPLTGGGRSRKGMPKVVRATRPGAARNAAREKPEMVVRIRSCAKSRYWKPSPGSLEWRVSTNRPLCELLKRFWCRKMEKSR